MSFRLTSWYVGMFSVLLLLLFAALYLSVETLLERQAGNELADDVDEFRRFYAVGGWDEVIDEIEREMASENPEEVFFRVLDAGSGASYATDLSMWPHLQSLDAAGADLSPGAAPVLSGTRTADEEHGVSVVRAAIAPGVIMEIGESTADQDELMEIILGVFVIAYVTILPLASLVGWMAVRKASRGIRAVSDTAARIQHGALEERVRTDARDREIRELAATFNSMLDRIGALIAEIRQMTDNVAHDLRSPLARIRATWEGHESRKTDASVERAALDTMRECDRLLHMINATLDLAEVEAGVVNGDGDDLDLSGMVIDAADLFEAVAEVRQIAFDVRVEPACRVRGHAEYLQRMIANLLDNAMKYTPAGGRVSVSVRREPEGVVIDVEDSGVGIAEKDFGKIFERFFRGDQSRQAEGCGMGLSFSRAVARAHRGDIIVRSVAGAGSTFTTVLPRVT